MQIWLSLPGFHTDIEQHRTKGQRRQNVKLLSWKWRLCLLDTSGPFRASSTTPRQHGPIWGKLYKHKYFDILFSVLRTFYQSFGSLYSAEVNHFVSREVNDLGKEALGTQKLRFLWEAPEPGKQTQPHPLPLVCLLCLPSSQWVTRKGKLKRVGYKSVCLQGPRNTLICLSL